MGAKKVCPTCLNSGMKTGKLTEAVVKRTCFTRAALTVALLGLIPCLWYFLFLTAPAAIVLAIMGLRGDASRGQGSLVHGRQTGAAVVSIILAVFQLIGFASIIFFIAQQANR